MQFVYTVYLLFLFVVGLIIGSFLNVCIHRIPKGISVAKGRSVCPACGNTIRWYDNIPVISYLFLIGKCRMCGERISPRYPVVELLGGASFLLVGLSLGLSFAAVLYCAFAAVLIAVAFIDADTQEIPDRFHIIILALGILALFLIPDISWQARLIGAAVISIPMLVIALLTGGFGMGDVKLMAVSGLLLGWKLIIFAGLLGAVIAALGAVIMIAVKKKTKKDKIAFGPYLAVGIFVAALYGDRVIDAYLGLFAF